MPSLKLLIFSSHLMLFSVLICVYQRLRSHSWFLTLCHHSSPCPYHRQIPLYFTSWMSSKSAHSPCVSLHCSGPNCHHLWLYTWATTFTTIPLQITHHVTSRLSQVGFPRKPTWDGDGNASSWLGGVSCGKEGRRSKLGQREKLSCSDVSTETLAKTGDFRRWDSLSQGKKE